MGCRDLSGRRPRVLLRQRHGPGRPDRSHRGAELQPQRRHRV